MHIIPPTFPAAGQARFRIEGSGALRERVIVPASSEAVELLRARPAAIGQAIRGVLELVEHAAGGAEAAAALRLHGIALAADETAHASNTIQAHLDNDTTLHASVARLDPVERERALDTWAERARASALDTDANVVAGWLNVGPELGATLLRAATGAELDQIHESDAARMVRVLRHEAQHLADQEIPLLDPRAALVLREVTAEARSTSLVELSTSRRLLGLDAVVSDAALTRTVQERPYAAAERAVEHVLQAAGVVPGTPRFAQLLALPAHELAEQLVQLRGGSSSARRTLERELAAALDAPHQ